MGADWGFATEGGGVAGRLRKKYHTVLQAVLLFGVETWVLLAPMTYRLEGVHVGFLQQVTKSKAKTLRDELWRKAATEKLLQGATTQPLQTYFDRRQAIVAEWVALRPIFDVCAR